MMEIVYARLRCGSRWSWLPLLAAGWSFPNWIIEPMDAHHGQHAVLMTREIANG